MRGNTISIHLDREQIGQTGKLYQYDHGQRLIIEGCELPQVYQVHFSNEKLGKSKPMIGDATGVDIPDEYLLSGEAIHVWIYVTGEDHGETEYHGVINVTRRAKPTDIEPTPQQESTIDQIIGALNDAVDHADEIAESIPGTIDAALEEAKESGEFDGFSPSASVSKSGSTATITITDKTGTTTAQVSDGAKGDPGEAGADGFSPYASVEKNGDTATIVIVDKYGSTVAEVRDGQDGADGYSPTAVVAKSGKTATITVTDKNGTTTATVSDGETGEPGPSGVHYGTTAPTDPDVTVWVNPDGDDTLIDDTAGTGTTNKAWSANKLTNSFAAKADKAGTVLDTTLSRGRKANTTVGTGSFAFGTNVEASGEYSHAEGGDTTAGGAYSHTEGGGTIASGYTSHAEGGSTTASGNTSHAEGGGTTASGGTSHAEGGGTTASGNSSHAEGTGTTASGGASHAEGGGTTASGDSSHAEGGGTTASGNYSHAEGMGTVANGQNSHVGGMYNIADSYTNWPEWTSGTEYSVGDKVKITSGNIVNGYVCTTANTDSEFISSKWVNQNGRMNYAEIIGNGTSTNTRSNARTLDWAGNEELAGDLTVNKGTADEVSVSDLKDAVDTKLDLPSSAGTAGQVLGLDSNLDPVWVNQSSGTDGVTFTPSVSQEGVISWTNDGGRTNPQSVNIKGPKGDTGDPAPSSAVVPAVEDWLDENVAQETGYVLDRTLLLSNAAAPADLVGTIKNEVNDLDDNLYNDIDVVVGGSKEFSDTDTFTHGLGNIRYFSYTSESEYEINKLKIRAYANESTVCKFKLITIEFSGTNVYVRKVSDEITLEDPTGTFEDYTITFDTPFVVPAGQMVGICGSDSNNNNWLYYSEVGTDVSYYVRTQAYTDIVADYRVQTYLPPLYTGKLPITFYSGDKEFIHIYTGEEIEEIAEEAAEELSEDIEAVSNRVDELAENKNSSSSLWQSGVWKNNSDDSVASNDRYICTKNAVPDSAGIIINDDTTNYKYVITAHDMSATYHGKGTYNSSTGEFEMYTNNYITVKEFDLDGLRKKFPTYDFVLSLCKVEDVAVTVSSYFVLRFMNYRFYDKNYIDNAISVNKAIYVSATGNDANSGKLSSEPVLTVNRALELGATDVLVSGGVYEQTIDLSKCNNPFVRIKNITSTGRVIFYAPDSLIAESETLVSGYTKVYSASTTHTFPSTTSKIFQDGVADEATEISDSDRHPLQRGNFYRCEDTKIHKCTSGTLSDALAEIENADVYKWFYDDGTIYFSRPQEITDSHPLRTGLYDTVFLKNGTREKTVEMIGIECKYMRLDLMLSNARIIDCKVSNACGTGIRYDNAIAIELIRCEVANAYYGTLGDGIAATGSASYGMAKGTTISMTDCWVHDNNDDGFSDHVGCESTIIGGLYEHNGKGGILPTGGGNCTCYNVTSRNNAIGFEIAGTNEPVASGRNGQQISCFGCIAKENSEYGFFCNSNIDMTMRLYSCKALNNAIGFSGPYNVESSEMIAVDCSGIGNTTQKQYSITIVTTTLLS